MNLAFCILEKTVFFVIDQFVFLPFLDGFDGQTQLFLDLIMGAVVEIRDAGMDVQNVVTALRKYSRGASS